MTVLIPILYKNRVPEHILLYRHSYIIEKSNLPDFLTRVPFPGQQMYILPVLLCPPVILNGKPRTAVQTLKTHLTFVLYPDRFISLNPDGLLLLSQVTEGHIRADTQGERRLAGARYTGYADDLI